MFDPVLFMQGVRKSFKNKVVLDGVDLAVPKGSVLGLLGKNGAGKSTLLKCALGLLRPQWGATTLLGEPSDALSAKAKARLGYVPQEISLYPWMKVRQVVAYTAAFYPHWNQPLIDKLIREWELNPEDRVGPLSVGQLQKLAILLALGHEPELLILDEPVASLDPAARRQFIATLLEIAADEKRTVIFSTHITSDLERAADRIALLKGGKIVFAGEQDQLKDSVKRLRISSPALPAGVLQFPGVLHCNQNGDGALLSVSNYTPALHEELARRCNGQVAVEDLNLEEIFLEMHQS